MHNIKLIILLFLILISAKLSKAQNTDSLLGIWNNTKQPANERADAYYSYIRIKYSNSNPDTALILAENLHAFSKTHKSPVAEDLGYELQAYCHQLLGNFGKALDYYQINLKYAQKEGNKSSIAKFLNNIGTTYSSLNNYPLALEYHQKALKISEQQKDKDNTAFAYGNIAFIYQALNDYKQALEYFQKSLVIFQQVNDKRSICIVLGNIGAMKINLGQPDIALDYYQKSLKLADELGIEDLSAGTLHNIGNIYLKKNNFKKAEEYVMKSLTSAGKIGNKYDMSYFMCTLGIIYNNQGKHKLALQIGHKSLAISEEIKDIVGQQDNCNLLYDTYKYLGNYTKALEYFEKSRIFKDSLFNEDNTRKLTQLEMQYNFDKKEAATKAEQEKKNAIAAQELRRHKLVRNGFIGGFSVVLLFAGVFLFQRNRIGKEKKRSEELLLNILPEETAKELKEKGHSDAQLIDQVTVLFTDFKGFTALSEKVTPKELVADLHECFSAFDQLCEKYGIEKIKTIGDAYMAAGGLPTPNKTHAYDVVKVALDMAKFIEEGKTRKISAGLPYFEIRIGVHTGPVVAGIVGIKKFQYDIWGDTVNTASRMESSGEPGKVNVSPTTYELLKDNAEFAFENRGKVVAKGKGELEMYFAELVQNNESI